MTLIPFDVKLARFQAAEARRKEREAQFAKTRERRRNRIKVRRYHRRKKREAREELRYVLAVARAVLKRQRLGVRC